MVNSVIEDYKIKKFDEVISNSISGSNCDRDVCVALEKLQFNNTIVWHKDTYLPKTDLIVIPGGFFTETI